MATPLIQMAIDALDFDASVALAEEVAPYVDIFEIGTPCIKHNGVALVEELRGRFPDKLLLVDLKTMDAGEYESAPFYAAGADICTVLGVSGLATCEGVIKAAKAHGAEAQIDLINVDDKAGCATATAGAGAQVIGIHTGLDAQAAGETPFNDLSDILVTGFTCSYFNRWWYQPLNSTRRCSRRRKHHRSRRSHLRSRLTCRLST